MHEDTITKRIRNQCRRQRTWCEEDGVVDSGVVVLVSGHRLGAKGPTSDHVEGIWKGLDIPSITQVSVNAGWNSCVGNHGRLLMQIASTVQKQTCE